MIVTAPPYADSYPSKHWKTKGAQCLTHAVEIDDARKVVRVLCGKVKIDSVCMNDDTQITSDLPTCTPCARRLAKLRPEKGEK